MAAPAQNDWIARVLGVRVAEPPASGVATAQPPTASTATPARIGTQLAALVPRLRGLAGRTGEGALGSVFGAANEAVRLVRAGSAGTAGVLLDRADALLRDGEAREALAAWQRARANAVGQLAALANAVRGSQAPDRDAAAELIEQAAASIMETPRTRAEALAAKDAVEDDPILAAAEGPNSFGFTIAVRQPLAAALTHLAATLPEHP